VFAAAAKDLVALEKALDGTDKESRGQCLWRQGAAAQSG